MDRSASRAPASGSGGVDKNAVEEPILRLLAALDVPCTRLFPGDGLAGCGHRVRERRIRDGNIVVVGDPLDVALDARPDVNRQRQWPAQRVLTEVIVAARALQTIRDASIFDVLLIAPGSHRVALAVDDA